MIRYGDTPVPWGAMWSDEDQYFVARCPYFGQPAICQKQAQGKGVPKFGQPHADRQRKLHVLCLCDICAKPLRNATKLSLSNVGMMAPEGHPLTQSEPLIHKECAAISLQHCPALRRQLAEGRLQIRQVLRHQVHPTLATAEETRRFVPGHDGTPILGTAVVEILAWKAIPLATFYAERRT